MKKILIVLAIIATLWIVCILLTFNEVKLERNFGEAIIQAPVIVAIEGAQKISRAYCIVTGGKVVSNCGISCGVRCVRPNKDSRKACKSSADCDGACIAELPIPSQDRATGQISELEPAILANCRKLSLPKEYIGVKNITMEDLGINTLLRSYECPSTVQIESSCQKYDYSGNELYWSYENGKVNLNRERLGM